MNAPNDNTAPKGLRGWWACPPRSGTEPSRAGRAAGSIVENRRARRQRLVATVHPRSSARDGAHFVRGSKPTQRRTQPLTVEDFVVPVRVAMMKSWPCPKIKRSSSEWVR